MEKLIHLEKEDSNSMAYTHTHTHTHTHIKQEYDTAKIGKGLVFSVHSFGYR